MSIRLPASERDTLYKIITTDLRVPAAVAKAQPVHAARVTDKARHDAANHTKMTELSSGQVNKAGHKPSKG